MKKLKKAKKKGFTLIELIIVIAILGILAAIAVPRFGGVQEDAKKKADIATAKIIADSAMIGLANGTVEQSSYSDVKKIDTDITDIIQSEVIVQYKPYDVVENQNYEYYVQIESNGDVEVFIYYGTDNVKLYPTPESPWN